MTIDKSSTLSLEKMFKFSLESDKNEPCINTKFNNFQNYYTNTISKEISAYCWILNLWSSLIILSSIPMPFLNIAFDITMGYSIQYYTINKYIGRTMGVFMGLLFLSTQWFVWQFENYLLWGTLIWFSSMGGILASYYRLEKKNPSILFSEDSHYLYIVPLYCYCYLDNKYNINHIFCKYLTIIVNYIKRFSTSDIIHQNENKKDTNEYGDYSGISHSDKKDTTDTEDNKKEDTNTEDNETIAAKAAAEAAAEAAAAALSASELINNITEKAVLNIEEHITDNNKHLGKEEDSNKKEV